MLKLLYWAEANMARMKIGSKDKKKQPEASYAIEVSMAPQEEKAPEVVEKIVEVEKVVEKIVEVEVPVRLGEPAPTKKCDMCKEHKDVTEAKVAELEGVMAASADEMQDLVEGIAETVKVQDRRIKEIEIEIDREMSSQINTLEAKLMENEARNAQAERNIKQLEKICAGIIVVTGLMILMVVSIN